MTCNHLDTGLSFQNLYDIFSVYLIAMKQVTNYTTICVKAWNVTEKQIHSFVTGVLAGSTPTPH
jgi:hypothetical protein